MKRHVWVPNLRHACGSTPKGVPSEWRKPTPEMQVPEATDVVHYAVRELGL